MEIFDFILYFLCTLVVPFLVSWKICPMVVKLAKEKNLTDCPGNRKLQKKPVPVVGGVCVFTALVISLTLFYLLNSLMVYDMQLDGSVLVAFAMIWLVGFFDDMVDISAGVKFVFQFLAIGMLIHAGYVVDGLNGLFGITALPGWFAVLLSLVGGVGIINAINMIDGVNGLSSSVGITMCTISAVVLTVAGDYTNAAIALVFAGALVPFFIANAFSLKYKMFIGDSGALMLGTLGYLVVCSVLHAVRGGTVSHATYSHSIALVLAILAMPVADTLRVMSMRMLKGRSPFSADKTHLHHILLELKVPHLAVTSAILLLGLTVFGSWAATNWWVENAEVQLAVVVGTAMLCAWGTYAFLARCRDKKVVVFQRIADRLSGLSTRIRTFRRKVEGWYDGRLDRRGYCVPEFDIERMDALEAMKIIKRNNKNNNAMNEIDYHAIDLEKVLRYIGSEERVAVSELIEKSGAEKLRVYPILFELEQQNVIEVLERAELGAPRVVAMARKEDDGAM